MDHSPVGFGAQSSILKLNKHNQSEIFDKKLTPIGEYDQVYGKLNTISSPRHLRNGKSIIIKKNAGLANQRALR